MPHRGELIDGHWFSPTVRLSAVSGLGWALIAWFIGYRAFGYRIAGGIVIAPFIGIWIGRLSSSLQDKPRWVQIAASLFDLYVAAACFAVGVGLFSAVSSPHSIGLFAVLMVHVWAVLWGLTFSGYALVLWPLSFFNHRLVWLANAGETSAPPEARTTSTAIRKPL